MEVLENVIYSSLHMVDALYGTATKHLNKAATDNDKIWYILG